VLERKGEKEKLSGHKLCVENENQFSLIGKKEKDIDSRKV
jgi:hypothetical protein